MLGYAGVSRGASSVGLETCPVTIPTRTVPPDAGFTAAAFNYGGRELRVALYWPNGTLRAGTLPGGGSMATINPDGSIRLKLGWWRGVRGKLSITGRRVDGRASPLRAHIPDGYGPLGFRPTSLTFPTLGCWRVVGRQGPATLSFVVRVSKVRKTS